LRVEEAGEIAEAAKANLWLSIGHWKNEKYNLKKKLLLTANPKKGWMKREFVDPFKAGILEKTRKFVSSLATDNTYNSPDYVATLAAEKDAVRRQRYLGDWDSAREFALVSLWRTSASCPAAARNASRRR
jgi:hypothetical protein